MNKWMLFVKKFYKKVPVLFFDTVAILMAWCGAYWFRFNMQFSVIPLNNYFLKTTFFLISTQILAYYYFKVYRGLWRFSSLNDVVRIIKAVIATTVLILPLFYLTSWLTYIPRSILPLYSMILIILLCSGRLLIRCYL